MSEPPVPVPPLPADERVLLLLGLLTSQDRHGYEINDFIEHQLSCVTDLKKATAYQLLDRLEQHCLIESRTEQHGNRPNRKVYTLTEAGWGHFRALLAEQLPQEVPLILPGNIPIMFHEQLPLEQQVAALREREGKLLQRLEMYERFLAHLSLTTGVKLAVNRIQTLTEADLQWTRALATQLSEQLSGRP